MGVAKPDQTNEKVSVNLLCKQDTSSLETLVEQFWKTESFGVAHKFEASLSMEDRKSMHILEQSTCLLNGHYEVGMLWRNPETVLPNNYQAAARRFQLLERRLTRDNHFRDMYSETLNSYIKNGYAQRLTSDEACLTTPLTWYIPHHGVTNPNKPGKVRTVFDAAATYRGTSLNSNLMTGPDLLNNLFGILIRFRLYKVAIVADVEGMFHQVRVPVRDTEALRFLWKEDILKPGPPDVYKMKVHIFGAVDSPSCANYAIKRTAQDNCNQFSPLVIETALKDFYVDDLLKSVETPPEAVQLYQGLTKLFGNGGFRLHKWMSNSYEVLDSIIESERAVKCLNLDLDDIPVQRTLGLKWNVQDDVFIFDPHVKLMPTTKRGVISIVSSIFDPCGFLAPFTFRAKCLIQEVWRTGIQWDDKLTTDLEGKWNSWLKELDELTSFQLPRHHISFTKAASDIEVHLFADASERGFGSVAYLKYLPVTGNGTCSFVAAKTRVAPIKPQLSIPRLELQAAVLAVRLWNCLKEELPVQVEHVYFWTDSMTVIQYINNQTRRFKPFVSNRIAEILDSTNSSQWYHVSSDQNPADYCSRGLPASKLTVKHSWFMGPSFLYSDKESWPVQPVTDQDADGTDPEIKISCLVKTNGGTNQEFLLSSLKIRSLMSPERFSTWQRLLRHTAWLLRALRNFLVPVKRLELTPLTSSHLFPEEYENALLHWTKQAQEDGFPAEINCLNNHKDLPAHSTLLPLTPSYDEHHLRLQGRLRKANVPHGTWNQIILPKSHVVTDMLLTDAHMKTFHGGVEHMVAHIRERFWPISVRQTAKKVIRQCFLCKKRRASPKVPRMADLPRCRTDYSGPFYHTGVDYFGPMYSTVGRRTVKRWGCLFTCMGTRAIHLELADSLETDDFILIFRNFIGRRGHPKHIYSDNGTNFVGANNELKEALQDLNQRIGEYLAPQGIEWHFNPPLSPHFGGAWERLVRSTKAALYTVIGTNPVPDVVLRTVLIEVEAALNSRPLTYNSSDPNDFTALTPNHFLIGRADYSTSPSHVEDKEVNSRRRWRRVQVIANHVVNRFRKEYLPSLSLRNKWKVDSPPLKVNDLVLLIEDTLPRGSWPLGRIIEVYHGDDNRIRSVKVKTPRGTFVRPTARICLLEEDTQNQAEDPQNI